MPNNWKDWHALSRSLRQTTILQLCTYPPVQFTNMTKGFKGTLDYILYTTEALQPTACLELPEEADLGKGSGLPNEHWSSDHIALMAEFQYLLG